MFRMIWITCFRCGNKLFYMSNNLPNMEVCNKCVKDMVKKGEI